MWDYRYYQPDANSHLVYLPKYYGYDYNLQRVRRTLTASEFGVN